MLHHGSGATSPVALAAMCSHSVHVQTPALPFLLSRSFISPIHSFVCAFPCVLWLIWFFLQHTPTFSCSHPSHKERIRLMSWEVFAICSAPTFFFHRWCLVKLPMRLLFYLTRVFFWTHPSHLTRIRIISWEVFAICSAPTFFFFVFVFVSIAVFLIWRMRVKRSARNVSYLTHASSKKRTQCLSHVFSDEKKRNGFISHAYI